MLSKLQSVSGTPMESQRKRHLPDSSSSELASKQLCMAASQVSILDEDSARLTPQSQSSSSCQPGDHAFPDVQVISTGLDNLMPLLYFNYCGLNAVQNVWWTFEFH